jgi:hypothetical protein
MCNLAAEQFGAHQALPSAESSPDENPTASHSGIVARRRYRCFKID